MNDLSNEGCNRSRNLLQPSLWSQRIFMLCKNKESIVQQQWNISWLHLPRDRELGKRTTDAQRGNSLHWKAENAHPLPNLYLRPKHILSATLAQFFRYLWFIGCLYSVIWHIVWVFLVRQIIFLKSIWKLIKRNKLTVEFPDKKPSENYLTD